MKLQRSPVAPRIGLTPLIDVVFILLLFFMLATSFQQSHSILLKFSTGTAPNPQTDRPVLTLRLTPNELLFDGRTIRVAQLAAQLDQRLASEPALTVVVRGASMVSVQRMVQVVDQLRLSRVVDYQLDMDTKR